MEQWIIEIYNKNTCGLRPFRDKEAEFIETSNTSSTYLDDLLNNANNNLELMANQIFPPGPGCSKHR